MKAARPLSNIEAERILKGVSIPAQPTLLVQLREEQIKPYPNIRVISDLVSKDIALSAAVLKTINSPYYGLARRMDSIHQATTLLGVENVSSLVTTAALRSSIKGNACISLERFWDSATDVANISLMVAKQLYLPHPDYSYTLGLFHDCGIALMAQKFPDYRETLAKGNSSAQITLVQVEDDIHNTNHATVGYYTCRSWGLPDILCSVVQDHHNAERLYLPGIEHTERNQLMAVLKMAANISHTFRRLQVDQDWEQFKGATLQSMAITEDEYEELKQTIHESLQH